MIYQLTNPLLIPKLLEMAKAVPDTPLDKLEKMLIEAMTSKQAKIFVDEKNNEIRGFIFGSVENLEGEDCIFIQFCIVKPIKEERHIGFELLLKMRLWGKELGLNYIYTITDRNPKGYIRKYGFEHYANVLRKKIVDDLKHKEVLNELNKKNIPAIVPV